MSKQVFTVLIIGIAVLIGFGAGCGSQEPTALEETPAIEQTSVAGRLQTISSDTKESEIKSPGSVVSSTRVREDVDTSATTAESLERGQVKILNTCDSLNLYLYNPAYHGTSSNPKEVVGKNKKLIWQTLSGTPSGWATVLSAGQEYWGWRFCRKECLDGSW